MKKRILAIDPGASGGLVEVFSDGRTAAMAMPDDADLRDFIRTFAHNAQAEGERAVCYMEQVGGFVRGNPAPGSAMFNFGNGVGYLRGLIDANFIERRMVRPQAWQAGIPGVSGSKPERKRALKEHAARLFPHLKVTLSTADALCIADYARRQEAATV